MKAAPISESQYFIYKITNLINKKIYIGQTIDPKRRWSEHKSDARKRPKFPISFSINKYGEENFIFQILEKYNSILDANNAEIRLISEFNSRDREIGYNIKIGGDAHDWSDESKQKLSKSKMGNKNAFFGKSHTLKTIKIISANSLGNSHRLGKITSDETKIKLSKAFSGENNPNRKLSLFQVNEIRKIYLNNEYTQVQLSELFEVSLITISRIINNKAWKN